MPHVCHHHPPTSSNPAYIRRLWLVCILNGLMFIAEVALGLRARSSALLADSLDFLGDSVNVGISIHVARLKLATRARFSLLKAACTAGFSVWILAVSLLGIAAGELPSAELMGWVSVVALMVNLACAYALMNYREGDSNMRSVWLCTRNDAIGNLLVMGAAVAVWFTHSPWPDVIVAVGMVLMQLQASYVIARQAMGELRHSGMHNHS